MFENISEWLHFAQSSHFMPHGHCYLWKPNLLLLHVISDGLIAIAYYSIPISLLYVIRKRTDLPYPWLFALFGLFILSCGTNHILEIWTAWNPMYWLSGGMKAVTATLSVLTAIVIIPLLPRIMTLKSPKQLEVINNDLRNEIQLRKEIELELIKAKKTAEEASRTKSHFLASISHELRTPLNGIIGMTDLMADTKLNEAQAEYSHHIKSSGETLLNLINDILDLSKIESEKIDLEILDFKLKHLISDTVNSLKYLAKEKDIEIKLDYDSNLPEWVKGDSTRVKQILVNLITNALKFTEKGSVQIKINSIEQTDTHCQFKVDVIDSGIGITPDAQKKLFKKFVQASTSIQRKFGGTGLGLSICKLLIDKMDGEIGVTSEEGKGSHFWFKLSLLKGEQSTSAVVKNENLKFSEDRFDGIKILVVDDNIVNQKIILASLKKLNITAQAVGNGIEVLAILEKVKFDLIFMDCLMPEMDGFEATKHIRESGDPLISNSTIIALTANAMVGDKERCIECGMDDYISKPIMSHKLYQILDKWIPKKS